MANFYFIFEIVENVPYLILIKSYFQWKDVLLLFGDMTVMVTIKYSIIACT